MPACAAINAPVQIVMIVVPTALCFRTNSKYSSAGGIVLGEGPGKKRMSSMPGATVESFSELVTRTESSDVTEAILSGPSRVM